MVTLVNRIVPYRAHIVDQLKTNIAELRDVAPHVGNFGVETLSRFSSIVPSARVSFLGMKTIKRNNVGQMVGPATSAIFICDKDPLVGQVYGPVLNLAEKVADFIDLNQFGLDYAAAAIVTDIEPIYSEAVDELGISLVGVMFEQEIQVGRSKHDVDLAAGLPGDPDYGDLTGGTWPTQVEGNEAITPAPDTDLTVNDPDFY
jgi:hypothetical protein